MGAEPFWRRMRKLLAGLRRDQRGNAVALVAAGMTVILGAGSMVVDYGRLAVARVKLQNAADAAALAGAARLALDDSADAAVAVAAQYLALNGAQDGAFAVSSPEIQVEVQRDIPYTLGRALGLTSATVRASARACYLPVSRVGGAAPLTVRREDFVYGQRVALKVAHWKDGWLGSGRCGALRLGGQGANTYEENLKHGYAGYLAVGDIVETKPGNMSGPTVRGIDYRLDACPHDPACTVDSWVRGCPRVLIVPVSEPYSWNGNAVKEVRIVGFAAFLVQDVVETGDDCNVYGYFVRTVTAGRADGQQASYGVLTVKLVG
ncbi:MAG: hypothetical protein XD69_1016 [Clostridia bacterium 62_21]|nr:MAG: hypothetical protein XD69_1016 [Clostridia bacterium 62_21]HAG07475.1 hypothetical protein [Peptococcaceae bacterium]